MTRSRFGRWWSAINWVVTHPLQSVSWIWRGASAKDRIFAWQTTWYSGDLPRVPLAELFPATRRNEVYVPNAFDRKPGTSISVEEACHLGALTRSLHARRVLEIGTYDGNSALVLASNSDPQGIVVTVDLPPDFDTAQHQSALAFPADAVNLTARDRLGSQFREHPVSARIRQVYGDSGSLDWSALGGPFDLIFIDGCHTESYVESDTRNALKYLTPDGIVVWHDYGMIPEVSKVVDRFALASSHMKFVALEGTRLAIAFVPQVLRSTAVSG